MKTTRARPGSGWTYLGLLVGLAAGLDLGCDSGGARPDGGATGTGGSAVCGGITGATCAALDWCDFPGDTCGVADQQGHCKSRDPTGCDNQTAVCGCDGKSYRSECAAHLWGTD